MGEFKPYEEYIEVDLPWLERIPSHWGQRKVKYLFDERVEKGYPDETLLAATQNKGVVPKHMYENRTVVAQKDLHLLKLVKKGDFVISLRSFQGGIEYAYYQGIISPAYTIMIPKSEIAPGFFKHLGKSKLFIELLKMCVTGIREGQNIDYNVLKNSMIPLPPKEEQDKIAKFLDNRLSKINRFIKAKKKEIELFKELKQAIINQAITKGIDPSVPKKDSGVEWLGEIPEHWEIKRIKNNNRLYNGNAFPIEYQGNDFGEIPFYKVSDINKAEIFVSESNNYVSRELVNNNRWTIIPSNCILFAKIGEALKKNHRKINKKVCLIDNNMQAMYPYEINLLFQYYLMRVIDMSWFDNGGTVPSINTSELLSCKIPFPPIEEQQAIVIYIETKIKVIEKHIDAIQSKINLLREYRTSLISAVVTGKVDVRHIPVEDTDEFIEDIAEDEEGVFEEEIGEEDKEVLICQPTQKKPDWKI
jgi:type I restriction enzyme S subunit